MILILSTTRGNKWWTEAYDGNWRNDFFNSQYKLSIKLLHLLNVSIHRFFYYQNWFLNECARNRKAIIPEWRSPRIFLWVNKWVLNNCIFMPFYATKNLCLALCQYHPCLIRRINFVNLYIITTLVCLLHLANYSLIDSYSLP